MFGEQLLDPGAVASAGGAFGIFCALSSAMYLVNDLSDRDRLHPAETARPIAAGRVSPATALGAAGMLIASVGASAFLLEPRLALLALIFVGLLTLYSRVLRQVAILDVLAIAIWFVLLAMAGAVVVDVPISQWLLVCTLLLALFLGFTKRRQEVGVLGADAMQHRPTLGRYNPQLLDQLVSVVAAPTLVSYAVYTTGAETVERFGTELLTLTIPFPIYGVLRYLMLIHDKAPNTGPSDILLRDRPLAVCLAGWTLSVAIIIYRPFAFDPPMPTLVDAPPRDEPASLRGWTAHDDSAALQLPAGIGGLGRGRDDEIRPAVDPVSSNSGGTRSRRREPEIYRRRWQGLAETQLRFNGQDGAGDLGRSTDPAREPSTARTVAAALGGCRLDAVRGQRLSRLAVVPDRGPEPDPGVLPDGRGTALATYRQAASSP